MLAFWLPIPYRRRLPQARNLTLSLRNQQLGPVPENTRRLAKKLYPKGHPLIAFADAFENYLDAGDFEGMYPNLGQSAIHPVRLFLVMLLQNSEGLSNRQAAARHTDSVLWKYVTRTDLEDLGFDHSVLSEFQDRLIENEGHQMVFNKLLDFAKSRKLLKIETQRTDALAVLSVARKLTMIELLHESMRVCLDDLTAEYPVWLNKIRKPEWGERYCLRPFNYKLGKSEKAQSGLAATIGNDIGYLLEHIFTQDNLILRQLESVLFLARIYTDNFDDDGNGPKLKERLAPAGERLSSPHDQDARWGSKRGESWLGFKKHLTETLPEDGPHLITNVLVTAAHINDSLVLNEIHKSLKDRELKPSKHIVDKGYAHSERMQQSLEKDDIDVVCFISDSPSWQGRANEGFDVNSFEIDYGAQTAVCPAGNLSQSWKKRNTSSDAPEEFNVVFAKETCRGCPFKSKCTKSESRVLHIKSKEVAAFLTARREEQKTPEFKKLYAKRSGVEGTISSDVNKHKSRRSRVAGAKKVEFVSYMIATAMNALRIGRHLMGSLRSSTRTSRFQQAFGLTA